MTSEFERNHEPQMSAHRAAQLWMWHEAAYGEMRRRGAVDVEYLGRQFEVPACVFAPTPVSDLLGNAVLERTNSTDRVLDMGTGCGANAVLAAAISHRVIGVDINPTAVAIAAKNAARNGVAAHTSFFESDVFDRVDGRFDLIVLDPPFRWFEPRDMLESSIADPGYAALTRFMNEAADHLTRDGRILLTFGSSGDSNYLMQLIEASRFAATELASRELQKDGLTVTYFALELTRDGPAPTGTSSSESAG